MNSWNLQIKGANSIRLPLDGDVEAYPSNLSHRRNWRKTLQIARTNIGLNEDLSQRGWERDASHNSPMALFIVKIKRLECPCGLKRKLQLMKGSLVWLSLRYTGHHRTDHLLLHFHMTSAMMPHAPPTVAHSLLLRQNWETLAWLTSRWSKPLDVDVCPHTVFIRSSILRHKSINLLPLSFEA
jgi:hypothetical protein